MKYAVLLCGDDEDVEVVKAASGGLAMLTAQSKKCCEKVFDVSRILWFILEKIFTDEAFEYTVFHITYFYQSYY